MKAHKTEDIEYLKKLILKKLSRLEEDIEELREQTKPISPDSAIGRISRMDAINNRAVNEATLRQSENQLVLLRQALSKIETEEYGICRICESPIPIGRMIAMPESDKCLSCANK